MKYRKFNRYEKKDIRREFIKSSLAGVGIYLYENASKAGELTLPRPTASGMRKIGPGQQFQGDDYYMMLVKSGDLRLIKVIQQFSEEEAPVAEKLILDQPETITEKGKIEHVVEKAVASKPLNEAGNQPQPEVLLVESPAEDGFVIVTD